MDQICRSQNTRLKFSQLSRQKQISSILHTWSLIQEQKRIWIALLNITWVRLQDICLSEFKNKHKCPIISLVCEV